MEGEVASGPQPDSSIVEAVMAMGFPENAAKRAVRSGLHSVQTCWVTRKGTFLLLLPTAHC